jgi:hypothetical protein
MTSITLTRAQVDKVVEIVTHFHEVNFFTIKVAKDSGIGEAVSVSFQLFDDAPEDDTDINITDTSIW